MEGSAEKEGDGEEDEDEDDDDMWEDAVELNNVVRDVEEIQAEKEEEREETERQQQMGIDGYLPRAAPHPVEAYVPTESPATPNMPLSSTTSIQEPALLFGPSDLAASRNTLERPRGKGRKSTVQDRLKKALGIRKQRRKKSLLDP